jgi:hypothetical protein
MNYVLIALIFPVIGVILYLIKNKDNKNEETKQKQNIEKSFKEDYEKQLLTLNIKLRTNCSDPVIIKETEEIIDKLLKVTNLINEPKNYSELTPLINRIGEKYLPDNLTKYLNLDENTRLKQKNNYLEGLTILKKSIIEVENKLENNDIADFNKQISFLNAFFEGQYNSGGKNE